MERTLEIFGLILLKMAAISVFCYNALSLWLSGLICFLSHSTCWALLADDLRWPGFKSRSGREFLVGWTNGRYAISEFLGKVQRVHLCVLSKL